jgi:transcriptional regulator with GAF, ATPase, and Fis domain
VIDVGDLPPAIGGGEGRPAPPAALASRVAGGDPLRERLVALLHEHHGNVAAVARTMGKARMQIQRWMKRYDVDARSFRR